MAEAVTTRVCHRLGVRLRSRVSLRWGRDVRVRIPVTFPIFLLLVATVVAPAADSAEPLPSIAEKTTGMERHDGFLPFHWDTRAGKVWLELPSTGTEFLYVVFLETGLGSNPVGLDRGQIGPQRIVRFERIGSRVRLVEPNQRYRAESADPDERRAVEESFATSVLWAGSVAAEDDGRVLVDATSLCIGDAHGIATRLKSADQGSFQLDEDRSTFHLARTLAFPENTEISVDLTFAGDEPGRHVRETAPTPESVTLRVRHSFLRLPDDGFRARRFDPRIGGFYQSWIDYAAPLDAPVVNRYLERHRLVKSDPGAPVSTAVEPIVYYVDRGAPEPVRSALVEGASWWAEAFEAAGFRDAFRVEVLPEGVDPLDARYNVIQWVHRSTRGWSYGSQIVDPRTGEILKGHVSLGSLRVRQDRKIFEGLFGPGPLTVELALARIRQLSAHEVGHTLGFVHNFAASASGRCSVMDYPAPWIRPDGDRLDASAAYDVGIGAWDRLAARYFYEEFSTAEEEEAGLAAILHEAESSGLLFASDSDARSGGAGHPLASLWDNGDDPVAALAEILEVRRIALESFGPGNLAPGQPLSELEDTLVPLYLLHRFQIDAAAKFVGGAHYRYDVVGAGVVDTARSVRRERAVDVVRAGEQRRAIEQLLTTLTPEVLAFPTSLLDGIPPAAIGFTDSRERFPRRTAMYFDPIAAARSAADMTVRALLQRERGQRMVAQRWLDPGMPGCDELVRELIDSTWGDDRVRDAYGRAIQREVERAVLDGLITLAADPSASSDVRSIADEALRRLSAELASDRKADPEDRRHRGTARAEIERFLARSYDESEAPDRVTPPPGSPIGTGSSAEARCQF